MTKAEEQASYDYCGKCAQLFPVDQDGLYVVGTYCSTCWHKTVIKGDLKNRRGVDYDD